MIQKLKALGLALIAVFAIGAVAASAASAAAEFTAETVPATITGEQTAGTITSKEVTKHEFTTNLGVVKCSPATFDGEQTVAASTELKLLPTYGNTTAGTGCTTAGIAGLIVHFHECYYTLTAKETLTASSINMETHLVCPHNATTGEHVEITTSSGCTTTIPPQTFNKSMVTAENAGGAGSAMDIKALIDVTGITYEEEGTNCIEPGVLQHGGTYKGVATLKGDKIPGGAADGVTVS
jgi:hypothetical protein